MALSSIGIMIEVSFILGSVYTPPIEKIDKERGRREEEPVTWNVYL